MGLRLRVWRFVLSVQGFMGFASWQGDDDDHPAATTTPNDNY